MLATLFVTSALASCGVIKVVIIVDDAIMAAMALRRHSNKSVTIDSSLDDDDASPSI